jgi:RHS repeat-associated protein
MVPVIQPEPSKVITSTLSPALAKSLASQLDPATGLQYHGDRYYDAWVGGYIQPDTFGGSSGIPQNLNRFTVTSGALLRGRGPVTQP